ncbi:MAG: TIGR02266 family protein [Myxococcota bacterium]
MTTAPNPPPPASQADPRRRHHRVAVDLEVTLESESNFYAGFSMNISEGGLFIATYDAQPVGTEVKVVLTLDHEGASIECRGQVRWVRDYNPLTPDTPPGMGVQFTHMSREDMVRIHGFCAERRDPLFYEE